MMKQLLPFILLAVLAIQCRKQDTSFSKKDWSSTYRVETGTPAAMSLTTYKTTLVADGRDKALMRIAVVDSTGKEIVTADTPFSIYVSGDAVVTGISEGPGPVLRSDSVVYWEGKLTGGHFMAYLRAGTTADRIKVEVKADKLWPSSHEIHTVPPDFKQMKPSRQQIRPARKHCDRMLGADISFLPQMESRGIKFTVQGKETDVIKALADHGFNFIRLRIFVNPENEKGYSPGHGFCGLEHTKLMARRVKEAGMNLLLNFHYSDYWADPQQQNKPLAWNTLDFEQLKDSLHEYTRRVLMALKQQGTLPGMVQVGNEINHGMLWPDGHISNPDRLAELLKAGVEGIRAVDQDIVVMMHIALGGQNEECVFWLDNMLARGVNFDVLGLSYYPRWHGTLDDLQNNLFDLAERYHKPLNVVEYSDYKKEVHDIIFSLPDDLGNGTCIWEPLWAMFGREGVANEQLFVYREIHAKHFTDHRK